MSKKAVKKKKKVMRSLLNGRTVVVDVRSRYLGLSLGSFVRRAVATTTVSPARLSSSNVTRPSEELQPFKEDLPFETKRKPETLRVVTIDRNGEGGSFTSSRMELALKLGFPLRDFRCLTKSFNISQVLVRAEAIILNLKYVRAVLTADRVMLMDEQLVSDDLVREVRGRIRTPFPARPEPFEVLALEGMLHYMQERLQKELGELEPAVFAVLAQLEQGDPTEQQLRSLLGFSKQLAAIQYDIGELKESLDRLLMSDEDMATMYLTDTKNGVGGRLQNHSEIEILLENYSRRLEETANSVSELQGYIGATEAFLKIRYDGQRNKIMRQTLLLSIATFSMGCGTGVASLFGMNLLNHAELHPHMFALVSGSIVTLSATVFVALFGAYRKNRTIFR